MKKDPFFAEAEKWADFDRSLRGMSPTPVKPRISPPRDCEVAYDADGKGNRPQCYLYLRHNPQWCNQSNWWPMMRVWSDSSEWSPLFSMVPLVNYCHLDYQKKHVQANTVVSATYPLNLFFHIDFSTHFSIMRLVWMRIRNFLIRKTLFYKSITLESIFYECTCSSPQNIVFS